MKQAMDLEQIKKRLDRQDEEEDRFKSLPGVPGDHDADKGYIPFAVLKWGQLRAMVTEVERLTSELEKARADQRAMKRLLHKIIDVEPHTSTWRKKALRVLKMRDPCIQKEKSS